MSQDFLDEHYDIPKISMINNIIHNNEGYGVVLVKPTIFCDLQENAQDETDGMLCLVIWLKYVNVLIVGSVPTLGREDRSPKSYLAVESQRSLLKTNKQTKTIDYACS